jgi:hypothetical protein
MQGFFVIVKLKLTSALSDPKSSSLDLARALIVPWSSILEGASFQNLITRSLLPKLVHLVKSVEIDPGD